MEENSKIVLGFLEDKKLQVVEPDNMLYLAVLCTLVDIYAEENGRSSLDVAEEIYSLISARLEMDELLN